MNNTYTTTTSDLLQIYNKTFDQLRLSQHHEEAYQGVYYFLQSQGKQIRPLLLMLSCEMFGGNIDEALDPAFAIQMFHNSTLVHDDIIDRADYRRGRPTVNKQFDQNEAIMAGNMMFIIAYQYLVKRDYGHRLSAMLKLFNQTAIRIMEGQALDLEFEKRNDIGEDEYLRMIEYKTAVLIATSLEIGAIIAGASEQDRRHIYAFGKNIGLAFQIKDDWLDAFGATEVIGKKRGGDIVQNKRTYLYVKAWQLANERQRSKIKKIAKQKNPDRKIEAMLHIYDELNIATEAEQTMTYFYEEAFGQLSRIDLESAKKEGLIQLTHQLFHREK